MKKLTQKEIQKIADLAQLYLSQEELAELGPQLSEILTYVDQLSEVDTSDVTDYLGVVDHGKAQLRSDESKESLSTEDVFLNASDEMQRNDYFKTSKIV